MKQSLKNNKRVIIIHGYKSSPRDCWFPSIKKELEKNKIQTIIPKMPNPSDPKINEWLDKLRQIINTVSYETILVGHSLGGVAILRYLEADKTKNSFKGIILIATRSIISKNRRAGRSSFFKSSFTWNKIKKKSKKFIFFYSKDDPLVSTENGRLLKKKLNGKLIFVNNAGHFSRMDNFNKFSTLARVISKL